MEIKVPLRIRPWMSPAFVLERFVVTRPASRARMTERKGLNAQAYTNRCVPALKEEFQTLRQA